MTLGRLLILSSLVVGCAANSNPPGGDAGPPDTAPDVEPDASPDSSIPDGAPTDTSVPDAAPECICPVLPTCAGAVADSPTFSPAGTSYIDQLMQVLACADTTLDAALYLTTYDCVVDAVEAKLASDSDLVIRLVIDDAMCPVGAGGARDCPLARIETHPRVTIVDDARSSLMHHKFMVADGARVWVASGNMTRQSVCTDYNNAIVVEQPEIVAGYLAHFEQMFGGTFGPQPVSSPVTGGVYTLYTSPRTPITSPSPWFDAIVTAIDAATTRVEVMTSAWTRTEVSDAMIRARGRGLAVRALVQSSYVDDPPAVALVAAGIEVRHDNVHSKVAIIDDLVVTGSPNWSMNAWSNNEAALFIDDAAIAGAYAAELDEAWGTASPP
jgi:phosphatidylserine/phosphatidylglycerophosphate/cardiolipin synthase-like enzyme